MRLSATKAKSTNQYRGLGDQLYDLGGARPTLDLNFANNESLVDSVTGKNLVTHTRASSATYVDGDGVIKDAVTNLLSYSENLSDSVWTKYNTTVSLDAIEAPDGTTSADKLIETTANNFHRIRHTISSATTGVFSVYVKADERTRFELGTSDTSPIADFNLTAGTVESGTGTIESVGNGWYRVSVYGTFTTSGPFILLRNDTTEFYTGDGTSGMYIWGAQLEESSTAGEYVKTTSTVNSAPRFDHDPVTGESLGLLVEEARTNLVPYSKMDISAGWTNNGSNSPTNLSLNKLGVFDGVRVSSNGQNWHVIKTVSGANNMSLTANTTYAFTVWYMNGDINPSNRLRLAVKVDGVSGACSIQSSDITNVNNYIITNAGVNHGTASNVELNNVGGGVYKLTFEFEAAVTSSSFSFQIGPFSTTQGASIIALGLQVEQAVFGTSYIPTSGATVTRAADITSIPNNDFGTFNLAQYSENVIGWNIKNNVIVSLDQETAPDGTRTADKVVENTATIEHYIEERTAAGGSGVYTHSVFVKAAGRTSVFFRPVHVGESTNTSSCVFDLTTGTAGTPTDLGSNPTIEAYPNGWYRISLSVTLTGANTTHGLRVHVYNGSALNYQGDGTSGYFVWGAQIEKSDVVTPYVKSDVTFTSRASTATYYDYNGVIQTAAVDEARNAAFLPDSNGNFISAGELLLEEARTNLFEHSKGFNASSAWNVGLLKGTATDNASTAPDGTLTATLLVEDTQAAGRFIYNNHSFVANQTYTISCWAKQYTSNRYLGLLLPANSFGSHQAAVFDITGNGSTTISHGSGTSSIEAFPNGWYRCSLTATATATQSSSPRLQLSNNSGNATSFYTGDGVSGIYVWGAQLEEGFYPTSYIPTSGSTVTRAADVSSSSTNTFGNSFYKQGEGTLFADSVSPPTAESTLYRLLGLTNGTSSNATGNRVILYRQGSLSRAYFRISDGAVTQATSSEPNWPNSTRLRIGVGFKENSMNASFGGNIETEDTSGTIPVIDRLIIGSNESGSVNLHWNSTISRITYWPTRLSDTTLQTITN